MIALHKDARDEIPIEFSESTPPPPSRVCKRVRGYMKREISWANKNNNTAPFTPTY
jgi:hypothetical protein